jgi:hypothetical protein
LERVVSVVGAAWVEARKRGTRARIAVGLNILRGLTWFYLEVARKELSLWME